MKNQADSYKDQIRSASVGKDAEKTGLSYTVGGISNCYSHYVKQSGGFSKNQNRIYFQPSTCTSGYFSK